MTSRCRPNFLFQMKKSELEKALDARFAEMNFPEPSNPDIPIVLRLHIAGCLARFYNGALLIVDRREDKLKIYTRP